jgi:hypothetical protein
MDDSIQDILRNRLRGRDLDEAREAFDEDDEPDEFLGLMNDYGGDWE